MQTKGHSWILIKLYLQEQVMGLNWPMGHGSSLQTQVRVAWKEVQDVLLSVKSTLWKKSL